MYANLRRFRGDMNRTLDRIPVDIGARAVCEVVADGHLFSHEKQYELVFYKNPIDGYYIE